MRFRNLLVASLSILVLASCTKDRGNNGGGEEPEGKPTVARVEINANEETRAIGFPGTSPTKEEREIHNVLLLIYNSSRILETVERVNIWEQTGSGEESGKFVSDPFVTSTGRHYVYAVVNAPALMYNYEFDEAYNKGGLESALISHVVDLKGTIPALNRQATIKTLMGLENIDRQGGFLMTSQGSEAVIFYDNPTNDPDINKFDISVGRALAKVSLVFNPTSQRYGHLTDVEYKVVNNPRYMYAFPNYLPGSNVLQTPLYYKSEAWPEPSVDSTDYLSESAHDYQPATIASTAQADWKFTYCMENSNYRALEGNTTCILIQAKFNPEANEWAIVDANLDPSTVGSNGDFWLLANYDSEGVFIDYDYNYCFTEEPTPGADQKVIYYKDGICYYALWLKNDAAANNGESVYTVKRNSYYRVTITSVSGPGSSDENGGGEDPGPIDPEVPLEGETNIVATINVLPWEGINQSGGI